MVQCKKFESYGKDFISLEFTPSYSNFPMYHRNDKLLKIRIILILNCKLSQMAELVEQARM